MGEIDKENYQSLSFHGERQNFIPKVWGVLGSLIAQFAFENYICKRDASNCALGC